jgi:hypothetical protein
MIDLKIGSLIKYNFLYSNEEDKTGIVCKIKKDPNFSYIVYVLVCDEIVQVPYTILDFKKIE